MNTSEPIYERVLHDVEGLFHPHRYDDPETPATPAPEATVDLATIEQDVRDRVQSGIQHAEAVVAELKAAAEQHLPQLAAEAQRIQGTAIAQALEDAVLGPADEALVAQFITRLGQLAASSQPQQAAAAPADDPAMGEPQPVPAPSGPTFAGQA